DVTVACDASKLPASTGEPTVEDNCDPSPVFDYSDASTQGSSDVCSGQNYVITRTWTATDVCSNTAQPCVQTITVSDNAAPVIACPFDVTVNCEDANDLMATGMATVTDNCDPEPGLTLTDMTTAGSCPQERTVLRTWLAIDNCGNPSACTQTITVVDETAPMIACPNGLTIECDESLDPQVNTPLGVATAEDNCDMQPAVTYGDAAMGSGCVITVLRTWTAEDACGNTATCTQVITIEDTTDPVMTCPPDVTIECDESLDPTMNASLGVATVTDNCDEAPASNYADVTQPGATPCLTVIQRNWIAADDCNNAAACSQTITIVDSTPPVLNTPANITVQCDAIPNVGSTMAQDNCDPNPGITYQGETIVGDDECANGYQIIRTWSVSDACGNSAIYTQTIMVLDQEPPVWVNAPDNLTVSCNNVPGPATMIDATDACDPEPVVVYLGESETPGNCPNEYTLTRTWTATDACGNSTQHVQVISVVDDMAPTIVGSCALLNNYGNMADAATYVIATSLGAECPSQAGINLQQGQEISAGYTIIIGGLTVPGLSGCFADNCAHPDSIVAVVQRLQINDIVCAKEFRVVFQLRDQCGNLSADSIVYVIELFDDTPPLITAGQIAACYPTVAAAEQAALAVTTAEDDCQDDVTLSVFTVGSQCEVTVNVVATDPCGNADTVSYTTIVDNTPPNVVAGNIASCFPTLADAMNAAMNATGGGDFCSALLFVSATANAQSCETIITVRVEDPCGNADSVQYVVHIDNQPPGLICPNSISVTADPNQCSKVVTFPAPTANDNCPGLQVTRTDASGLNSGDAFPVGVTTISFEAADACGLTAACSFSVTVVDDAPPVITCPQDISVSTAPNQCGAIVTFNVQAENACPNNNSPISIVSSPPSGSFFGKGVNYVLATATDANQNSSTCSFAIVVTDNQPPTLTCPNLTVSTAPGLCNTVVQYNVGVADNCPGPLPFTAMPPSGSVFDKGQSVVNVSATDAAGNTATCSFTVNVLDQEPPVITCPANFSVSTAPNQCGANVTYNVGVSDNCPGVGTPSLSKISGSFFDKGATVVTASVSDAAGNSAACSFTVTVNDTQAPMVNCPGNITVVAHPDSCAKIVSYIVTATDNCPGFNVSVSPMAGSIFPVGVTTVTAVATDASANSAQCTFTVTVQDNTPPTVTCPPDKVVTGQPCPAVVNGIDAFFQDNCPNVQLTWQITGATSGSGVGQASGQSFNSGLSTVRYVATDGGGGAATCTFRVTVNCATASGRIVWSQNQSIGVNIATVKANNGGGQGLSDINGIYSLNLPAPGLYTVTPEKKLNPLNGVSAADAQAINQHVFNLQPLPVNAFVRIAADVNKSNSITAYDATVITQALGGNQTALEIMTQNSWRFVPTTHVFANQAAPWGFPESITFNNTGGNSTGLDFIGIKIGDVAAPSANPAAKPMQGSALILEADDAALEAGQTALIDVRALNFGDIASWQFALEFDPAYLLLEEVVEIPTAPIGAADFGLINAENGEIRSVWAVAEGYTLPMDAAVFALQFRVLQGGRKLSELLRIDDKVLPALAFQTDFTQRKVQLNFADAKQTTTQEGADQAKLRLLQNRPNPFVEQTTVGFVLPEACEVQLRVIDARGQIVWQYDANLRAGYHEVIPELGNRSGMFFAELVTPFGKRAIRMIRSER
ncbi:MAG: HYR domain-containing protein, partial [Saprospiraceae bacterium]